MKALPGVTDVHDLHIWALTAGKVSLSVHINAEDIAGTLLAVQKLCHSHEITHTTIQVEPSHTFIDCRNDLH